MFVVCNYNIKKTTGCVVGSGWGEGVALQEMSLERNLSSQHTLRVSTYTECICMLPCSLIIGNSRLKSTVEQSSILLFLPWVCLALTRLRIKKSKPTNR